LHVQVLFSVRRNPRHTPQGASSVAAAAALSRAASTRLHCLPRSGGALHDNDDEADHDRYHQNNHAAGDAYEFAGTDSETEDDRGGSGSKDARRRRHGWSGGNSGDDDAWVSTEHDPWAVDPLDLERWIRFAAAPNEGGDPELEAHLRTLCGVLILGIAGARSLNQRNTVRALRRVLEVRQCLCMYLCVCLCVCLCVRARACAAGSQVYAQWLRIVSKRLASWDHA
jgi:hypothetical protein